MLYEVNVRLPDIAMMVNAIEIGMPKSLSKSLKTKQL